MRLKFDIKNSGEVDAGLLPYTDTVIIDVESGNPGGEDGEFMEFMQSALAEWFDGSSVDAENITKA